MGSQSATQRKRNDFAPELVNGKPTEAQITKERTVLFFIVLRGLGIPRQVSRFIHVIYTLTKPGKIYHFNDLFLADNLGCDGSPTTRNYVVNLRRKMREWNNEFYDEILRTKHFSFVSIVENEFDYKTKNQIPTGYIFSAKFADMLEDLIAQVRENINYKTDWNKAIREVCSAAAKDELKEFGEWSRRKTRNARPVEDILGTLLLNWKRLMRKMIETGIYFGFDKEQMADQLKQLAPFYINQARDLSLIGGPTVMVRRPGATEQEFRDEENNAINFVPVRASREDFVEVWSKVLRYVGVRETPEETILPAKYKSRLGDLKNVRSNAHEFLSNGARGVSDRSVMAASHTREYTGLESRDDISILQTDEIDEAMALSRQRFLARRKRGGGPAGKSGNDRLSHSPES